MPIEITYALGLITSTTVIVSTALSVKEQILNIVRTSNRSQDEAIAAIATRITILETKLEALENSVSNAHLVYTRNKPT